jgi:UDP-glucose 4-epimerase
MKILVTGGAGYIGSHTIIELVEQTDWEIISVDNYANSTENTYNRIENITGKKIQYFNVDLANKEATNAFFQENQGIDGVIHFAAFKWVGESVENPLKYYRNNVNSLINVLECQREFNIPYFIFSSSCSVYGNIAQLPVTEETTISKAESPYAYTKQIGEQILEDFIKASKDNKAISLRYFNPVGAHISGLNGEIQPIANNLLPYITQTAIGLRDSFAVYGNDYNTIDGTCVRDYIHVSDIASAHVQALELLINNSDASRYDVFNLGTGTGVSVQQIIDAFEKVNGLQLNYSIGPRRDGDVEEIYADNTKATQILRWEPRMSLEEMMLSAWKWEKYLQENSED